MFETVPPTSDNARPGRFRGGFRRSVATRLGPPPGFDQARAELADIQRSLAWAVLSWTPGSDDDEDTLADREDRSKEPAVTAEASQDALSIERLRRFGEAVRDQLRMGFDGGFASNEECEVIEQIYQSVELDLAVLDRLAVESHHQHRRPTTGRRPIPIRAALRCRTSHARRTRRAATKKTAATSTGDPDPEPDSDGDERARLRSVALIEAALSGGAL
jgi:hypothetical protein